MLTEREQEIINKSKEWGFAAYLQWAWLEYPSLQEEISKKRFPARKRLKYLNAWMNSERIEFDICYLVALPQKEINPLQIEQEAWRLLSPFAELHVNEFGIYIAGYSRKTAEQQPLLTHVNLGWGLLQQWNLISFSFRAKYKKYWDLVEEKEAAVRDLIQELRQKSRTETRGV